MRKIPEEFENPIDNYLIYVADYFNPIFRKLHFTPNILTTISLVLGLLSVHQFYKNNYIVAPILYFISYLFDVFDGHFARTYDMATNFGDYYDHISDIIKSILLFIVFMHNFSNYKIFIIIMSIIFAILLNLHLGCQEQINESLNEGKELHNSMIGLGYSKSFCPSEKAKDWIKTTRYFGCGTITVVIMIFMFMFGYFKNAK